MIIDFKICPRQFGKTTKALALYNLSSEDSLLVVPNVRMIENIIKSGNNIKNICTGNNFFTWTKGRPYSKHIILDEYLFFNNKENFYLDLMNYVKLAGTEKVTVFTTSDKIYNKDIFEYVKKCKESILPIDGILNNTDIYDLYPWLEKHVINELIEELYYSLMTEPNCYIQHNTLPRKMDRVINKEHFTKTQYKIEVEAQYLN